MPIGDFDLLSNALELHMFCTGSSDCIGFAQAHHIYKNLKRRLNEWQPTILESSEHFDHHVNKLCFHACREYTLWRRKYIEQFGKKPEGQECWQDGHFDKEKK